MTETIREEFTVSDSFLDQVLEKFVSLGKRASFHYADDTGKEWQQARSCEDECVRLYQRYPQAREQMMVEAKHFLWSLERRVERLGLK